MRDSQRPHVGRTPSSARDPLVALVRLVSTLMSTIAALLAVFALPATAQPDRARSAGRFPVAFAPSYDSPSQFVARSPAGVTILTGDGILLPGGACLRFVGA